LQWCEIGSFVETFVGSFVQKPEFDKGFDKGSTGVARRVASGLTARAVALGTARSLIDR